MVVTVEVRRGRRRRRCYRGFFVEHELELGLLAFDGHDVRQNGVEGRSEGGVDEDDFVLPRLLFDLDADIAEEVVGELDGVGGRRIAQRHSQLEEVFDVAGISPAPFEEPGENELAIKSVEQRCHCCRIGVELSDVAEVVMVIVVTVIVIVIIWICW